MEVPPPPTTLVPPPTPKYAESASSISFPDAYELGGKGVHPEGVYVVTPVRLKLLAQMLPSKESNSTGLLVMKSHRSFKVWPVDAAKAMFIPSVPIVIEPADIGTNVASHTIVVVALLLVQLNVSVGVPTESIWTLKLLFAVPVKVPPEVMSLRPVPVKKTGPGEVS